MYFCKTKKKEIMNVRVYKTESPARIIIIDTVLLGVICAVPALTHWLAMPLYKMNPMLMALLAGMLLVRPKGNSYLLAVLLPVVSMLLTGMPAGGRCVCMVAELTLLTAVYGLLRERVPVFVAMMSAMVVGKLVFYGLLALLVSPEVLVGTQVWFQAVLGLTLAGVYAGMEKARG